MNTSERDRKIYILRCKKYKYKEISEICGVSTKWARQVFTRYTYKLDRKEKPKEINEAEKRLMMGLYYILDDIKSIAKE
jgi:DNA-directed RNA polymerase specialized sigma24 family protein